MLLRDFQEIMVREKRKEGTNRDSNSTQLKSTGVRGRRFIDYMSCY
jgi:hypothetical protein